jgi:hypothetical protein
MAQLPTIASTANRRLLPTADLKVDGVSPAAFGAAVGAGLQQLGDAGADAGKAVQQFQLVKQQEADRLAEFDRQTTFVNFGSDQATKLEEARRDLSGPAQDFTKTFMGGFDADAAAFLEKVPERDRHAWAARMAQLRTGVAGDALRSEFTQRDSYYKTTIGDTLGKLQNGAMTTPDKLADWRAQGEQIIAASGLSAQDKLEYTTRWRGQIAVAAAQGDVMRDPEGALVRLGGIDHTTALEATGKVTPSGAPGGRYVNGWAPRKRNGGDNSDAAVDNYIGTVSSRLGLAPDTPITKDMLPRLAVEMAKIESGGQPSARSLRNNNPGNIEDGSFAKSQPGYAGSDGRFAKFTTAAQGSAAQEALLGKYLARGQTTVRQIIEGVPAKGAAGKPPAARAPGAPIAPDAPQNAPAVDPRYADLPVEARDQLIGAAQREIDRKQAVAAQAEQEAHSTWLNQFMNDLNDGKAGTADIEAARKSGALTDFDEINRAQTIVEQRNKQTADLSTFNTLLATPGFTWNPFDDRQTKAVEAAVKAAGGSPQVAFDIWQRTGILAESGSVALRGAMISTNPQQVSTGAAIASNMLARNPNAFAGVKGGDEIEKNALLYGHFVNDLGFTPADAAARVAQQNSPEMRRKIEMGKPEAAEFRKTILKRDVGNMLSNAFGGWFSIDPEFTSPEQRNVAAQDYADIAADHFQRYGDAGAAESYALAQMKKLYGAVNGRLMKYPPTRAYPAVGGDQGYIFSQAAADIKTVTGRAIDPKNVYLMPIPTATAEAFRAGKPTPYSVHYVDEVNGQQVYRVLNGKAFYADPAAEAKRIGAARKTSFERARKIDEYMNSEEAMQARAAAGGF